MPRVAATSWIVPVLLVAGPLAEAAGWGVPGFSHRRAVVINKFPKGAPACHVRFAHHGIIQKNGADIRVTTEKGRVLGHELLRIGPGDQVELLFDCSKLQQSAICYVYFGNSRTSPAKQWTAKAGIILEVRKKGPGGCNNWNDYQKMFRNSKEVMGRILRTRIFDGFNPLGPNQNFVSYYRAFIRAPKPGTYKFATNSDDASFLLVNGRVVAQYPGWHEAWDGRWAQHNGTIRLGAGVHKLEYYHVQGGGGMATIAGWQRPGDRYVQLMREHAFVPVARAAALGIERADKRPSLDFSWRPEDHLFVDGRYLIRYRFTSKAKFTGAMSWNFGDGQQSSIRKEEAPFVGTHLFTRPGTYTVTVEAGSPYGQVKQKVVVEPVWTQREEFPGDRWTAYRQSIVKRLESRTIEAADLLTLLRFSIKLEDADLLRRTSLVSWNLAGKLEPDEHAELFFKMGLYLQKFFRDFEGSDRAFKEVIEGPGNRQYKARSKLHRAGLLIHTLGQNSLGLKLLNTIKDNGQLGPGEPVLKRIYRADALAGLGKREEASKEYESLRNVVPLTNRKYAARRRGRLLTIQSHIRRKDYENAMQELRNIEWETPKERMLDETGLLRVECYLGQKDYRRARVLLERLLKVNPASARVPIKLMKLIEAYEGLKRDEDVEATFARLKKEYPYAEETALMSRRLGK